MAQCRQVEIRRAEPKDYPACSSIYADAWNSALPNAQRSIGASDFEMETKGELILVAMLDERVCGYISLWEPDWFIHHLYVAPDLHGTGVGTALLAHTEKLAKTNSLSLKCQLANTKAIGFYASLGFVETADRGTDVHGDWIRLAKS